MFRHRRSLIWLLVPYVLYLGVLPLANRIYPVVLTMPFLTFWMLVAVLATPLCVWLAARRDPVWRADRHGEDRGGDPS